MRKPSTRSADVTRRRFLRDAIADAGVTAAAFRGTEATVGPTTGDSAAQAVDNPIIRLDELFVALHENYPDD